MIAALRCEGALHDIVRVQAEGRKCRGSGSGADLLQRSEVGFCEEAVLPSVGSVGPDPVGQLHRHRLCARLRHPLHLVQLLEVLRTREGKSFLANISLRPAHALLPSHCTALLLVVRPAVAILLFKCMASGQTDD